MSIYIIYAPGRWACAGKATAAFHGHARSARAQSPRRAHAPWIGHPALMSRNVAPPCIGSRTRSATVSPWSATAAGAQPRSTRARTGRLHAARATAAAARLQASLHAGGIASRSAATARQPMLALVCRRCTRATQMLFSVLWLAARTSLASLAAAMPSEMVFRATCKHAHGRGEAVAMCARGITYGPPPTIPQTEEIHWSSLAHSAAARTWKPKHCSFGAIFNRARSTLSPARRGMATFSPAHAHTCSAGRVPKTHPSIVAWKTTSLIA